MFYESVGLVLTITNVHPHRFLKTRFRSNGGVGGRLEMERYRGEVGVGRRQEWGPGAIQWAREDWGGGGGGQWARLKFLFFRLQTPRLSHSAPPTGTPLRTPRHRRDPMIPASEPPFPDPGHRHRPKPTDLTTLFPDRAMLLPHKRLGRLFRAGTCGVEIQFRRTRSWSGRRVAGKAASRGARRGRGNRASTLWACADSLRLSAG